MTAFIVVQPHDESAEVVEFDDLRDVIKEYRLGEVDHGTIARGVGFVTYEFALFTPKEDQHYFTVLETRRLFAGTIIFYGFNLLGHTIDLRDMSKVGSIAWLQDHSVVEEMIRARVIIRPQIRVGETIVWSWPEPPLKELVRK